MAILDTGTTLRPEDLRYRGFVCRAYQRGSGWEMVILPDAIWAPPIANTDQFLYAATHEAAILLAKARLDTILVAAA